MRDKYGVEVIPTQFTRDSKNKKLFYKCILGNLKARLYAVYDEWNEVYFEVAEIKVFISHIDKRPFEHYPTDDSLGTRLWRFDTFEDADEFYNTIL